LAKAGAYAEQTGSLIDVRNARHLVNTPVVLCMDDECPTLWLGESEAVYLGVPDSYG